MTTSQIMLPAARKELFLLAARALADEQAREPGDRLATLVTGLAEDVAWMRDFLGWAREQPALRGFALATTVELVGAGRVTNAEARQLVNEALVRADEPGRLLVYAFGRFGRSVPKPIKEGVAKAVERLYDERALAVHDTEDAPMRFAEVIAFTHPKPVGKQTEVFQYAARRVKRPHPVPDALTSLRARAELHSIAPDKRARQLDRLDIADALVRAAMGPRDVAAWLGGGMSDKGWAAVVRSMSLTERLAHLTDFDAAGLAAEVADGVAADLADERSALPVEIWNAYRRASNTRWSHALEKALRNAPARVPVLRGRTLVLVDRSTAMGEQADAAVIFAGALALRSPSVELVRFGPDIEPIAAGATLLDTLERFGPRGDGQSVSQAVRGHVNDHERVIVLTHAAAAVEAAEAVTVPGHEHVITEVNDGWFAAIPVIELARSGAWPF